MGNIFSFVGHTVSQPLCHRSGSAVTGNRERNASGGQYTLIYGHRNANFKSFSCHEYSSISPQPFKNVETFLSS